MDFRLCVDKNCNILHLLELFCYNSLLDSDRDNDILQKLIPTTPRECYTVIMS